MLSKRLLYRNKIIRFYEEDVWGIFLRKQKRREFFFKTLSYRYFLQMIYRPVMLRYRHQWRNYAPKKYKKNTRK